MSVLINKNTKVIVQGFTGSQGTFQFGAPGNGFAITSGAGTAFNFQGSAADVTTPIQPEEQTVTARVTLLVLRPMRSTN